MRDAVRNALRYSVTGFLACAVLLFNPFFACSASFNYSAAEMRAAVEGTWKVTLTPGEPGEQAITFTVAQAGAAKQHSSATALIQPAAACDHRSLVKSAEACIDESEMPLDLVALDGGTVTDGMFYVVGLSFDTGKLELTANGVHVTATIDKAGAVSGVTATTGAATLARLAR